MCHDAPARLAKYCSWFYLALSLFLFLTYLLSIASAICCLCLTTEGSAFLSKRAFEETYSIPAQIISSYGPAPILASLFFAFIVSFLVAGASRPNLLESSRRLIRGGAAGSLNFLLVMPFICSTTFLAFFVIHAAEEAVGVQVGGIEFTSIFEELLFSSYSVVVEELLFRLLMVLLPISIYLAISSDAKKVGAKELMLLLFKPAAFQERFASGLKARTGEIGRALILASSLLFAYAHVAGGMWGNGKLLTALVAGIVLGYSALRYGLEASILIHWFYNAYWPSLGIISSYLPSLSGFYAAMFWATVISGVAFPALFAIRRQVCPCTRSSPF